MANSTVTGVRSIELGVRDLHRSAEFYTKVWALEEVSAAGDTMHFRATGGEHHVLTIRERPQASLLGVHFAAADRGAVDQLCAKAKGYGVSIADDPAPLDASAGGGYGFRFETPDGLPMTVSSDSAQHPDVVVDRSRPTKISHVVLNSARTDDQVPFFIDVLGFKLSDSTHMMEFLRCSADHHSIAIFRNNGPSLNHVAYELPNIDGLMRGAGRLKRSGFDVEWGSAATDRAATCSPISSSPMASLRNTRPNWISSTMQRTFLRMRATGRKSCRIRTAGGWPGRRRTGCAQPCRARFTWATGN